METSKKLENAGLLDQFVEAVSDYASDLEGRGITPDTPLTPTQLAQIQMVDVSVTLEAARLLKEAEAHHEAEQEAMKTRVSVQLKEVYGDNECEVCA